MPAPVIDSTTSILAYRKGEFFVYQPAAINSPTSWTAVGLPLGLSIVAGTGKISGIATEPGVYNVTIKASNADGTSAPLIVAIGIESVEYDPDPSIELNFDWITGKVTRPNMADDSTVLYVKQGDTLIISLGLMKGDELQDYMLGAAGMAFKEFDTEKVIIDSGSEFTTVGSYNTKRYKFLIYLDPDKLQMLSDYEEDEETFFKAVAEIQVGILHLPEGETEPVLLNRSSRPFTVRVSRDIKSDF